MPIGKRMKNVCTELEGSSTKASPGWSDECPNKPTSRGQ